MQILRVLVVVILRKIVQSHMWTSLECFCNEVFSLLNGTERGVSWSQELSQYYIQVTTERRELIRGVQILCRLIVVVFAMFFLRLMLRTVESRYLTSRF